ncbi:hypothetical protein KC19_3G191500 [Ceratodon purpureus]|uniref:Uncharacterized protein n=1 Tax=Ceratodon purpureus TaxID=3225 RepID=A0A8T0IMD8_CERPU|nr:hypothetical protein KC19_3G191500 [Ceratodon purpureus]
MEAYAPFLTIHLAPRNQFACRCTVSKFSVTRNMDMAFLFFVLANELDIIICKVSIIYCISSCGVKHGNVHTTMCDSLLECKKPEVNFFMNMVQLGLVCTAN